MNPTDISNFLAIERRVIGCELEQGESALLMVIQNGITADSFADPFCRRVHELILRQHAASLPFDLAVLWTPLKPTPEEAAVLTAMTGEREANTSSLNLATVSAELRDLANRRRIVGLAAKLTNAARTDPDEIAGIVGELLATQAEAVQARTWQKICDDADLRAQSAIGGKVSPAEFISWGFPALDTGFKKMRKGELVIIGARPSVGKSSLARAIAYTSALDGKHVLVESLEVSADDVADGMATAHSGLPFAEMAFLPTAEQKRFRQSIATLRAAPLHVCEDRTLAGIVARTRAVNAQQPLDVLVIDYLGLIAECKPGKGETQAQAVGAVTKALKRLAMELRIVVVCLAQLNRQSVTDGNREPRLSDLRDSGDIEQDADRVVFIHRPDECPISKQKQDTLDTLSALPRYGCALIQAKGRNVGTGYGAVWFNRRLARFEF